MNTRLSKQSINISVKDRIAIFEKTKKELISSPEKAEKYLQNTGIYNQNGALKKVYK